MASQFDNGARAPAAADRAARGGATGSAIPPDRGVVSSHDDPEIGCSTSPYLSPIPVAVTNAIG